MGRGRVLLLVILGAAVAYVAAIWVAQATYIGILNVAPQQSGQCVLVDDDRPLGVPEFRAALEAANATGNGFVERNSHVRASLDALETASEEQFGRFVRPQCVEWRGGNYTVVAIIS